MNRKLWYLAVLPLLSACAGEMLFVNTPNIQFRMLLEDSFERERVSVGSDFHWRYLLEDNGAPIEESDTECSNRVCARILGADQGFGPVADGDNALLFFGREGSSTHTIYLTSKSFDLSGFSKVEFSFDSLAFDLGDRNEGSQPLDEYIRLEVCAGTEAQCGLAPVDSFLLDSDRWVQIWQNDDSRRNNGLNGSNHGVDDWSHSKVPLDLSAFQQEHGAFNKAQFVFRFGSRLQDGFKDDRIDRPIEDAGGLDKIQVKAMP